MGSWGSDALEEAETLPQRPAKAKKKRAPDPSPPPPPAIQAAIEAMHREIPARMAQIRGARSQRALARSLGVYQQNVNRYENGFIPHPDFLVQLALQEGVDLNWLLLGETLGADPTRPREMRPARSRGSAASTRRKPDPTSALLAQSVGKPSTTTGR